MKFEVVWSEEALESLAAMWLQADATQRLELNRASQRLDQRLMSDPYHEGESRSNGKRIVFESRLIAYFRVEADGKRVTVLQVYSY